MPGRSFNGGATEDDIEGLVVVYSAGGTAYLLASSQGDDSFVAYRAAPDGWEFYRKFTVADGPATDGCSYTDGIDATITPLGPAFPHGMFVCQDDFNSAPGPTGNQNFKMVPLERILPVT